MSFNQTYLISSIHYLQFDQKIKCIPICYKKSLLLGHNKWAHQNLWNFCIRDWANLHITNVACAVGPSVTTSSTDFSFQNFVFGIYLNFQWQKSLQKQYLLHSESKSYQINSIKSCSSRSFQQHQRPIPIPPQFSVTI
jgi:hypothetical protein